MRFTPKLRISRPITVQTKDVVSRWMSELEAEQGSQNPTNYASAPFAQLWYAARAAGEDVRVHALHDLYTNRPTPGGPYPDPRKPASFSTRAVIAAAARHLGVTLTMMNDDALARIPASPNTLAYIITYRDVPPAIATVYTSNELLMHFQMACLMGYLTRERGRLTDPYAPTGIILLPQDPSLTALLHQFAISLLCLKDACPETWTCDCNDIRRTLNRPPADHQQQTDTTSLRLLHSEIARQKREA